MDLPFCLFKLLWKAAFDLINREPLRNLHRKADQKHQLMELESHHRSQFQQGRSQKCTPYPNPKRQKVEEKDGNWSNLCQDLLQIVLERLNPIDFDRARSVCSAWRSASRETARKHNRIPWLILFPYERSYMNSCRLVNPLEKSLVYRSRNLGVEFTQSRCIATCGSWLLMSVIHHHQTKLYILNPLTRERINLPPLEPFLKSYDSSESPLIGYKEKAVLWVDERSKDYFVFWSRMPCPIYSKKGDDSWRMFPYLSTRVEDLVYKGHLLYIYTLVCFIEIYDFSGDSPLPVTSRPYACIPPRWLSSHSYITATRIAVTTSGEVLLVICCDINSFYVYKMNHATETWDHMASLGDQALIFDLGITVPAKDIQGIKPDSIYFSGPSFGTDHIFIFNLATRKVEPFLSYTSKFFDARWFIPNV